MRSEPEIHKVRNGCPQRNLQQRGLMAAVWSVD
jgi:hypothetical protein